VKSSVVHTISSFGEACVLSTVDAQFMSCPNASIGHP